MPANWLKKIGKYLLGPFLGPSRRRTPRRGKSPKKRKKTLRRKSVRRKKSRPVSKSRKGKTKSTKASSGKGKKKISAVSRPVSKKKEKTKAAAKEVYVGKITHYFPKVNACAVKVEKTEFKVGDRVHIRGTTTDIRMKVKSLQISLIPVDSGRPGEEVGLEVAQRVRENDEVYLLRS
ncbi:MAG TPA: hypothetical protein PKL97_02820 [Candidatus Omnitrophota bacterium]|nr:hypothetical protein [Candidatus Omnitrophota bacterium]